MTARIAGALYLLTFVAGVFTLAGASRFATNLIADACYVAVTLLFYHLFKPVNASISALAALFGLVGITIGLLRLFGFASGPVDNLVLFGLFDLSIGYLILRSTFLPRVQGALMVVGGLGFLTFVSRPLGRSLSPYNLALGAIAAGALSLWLVVKGVNPERWMAQARRSGRANV